jgi:hypothetical protein
MQIAVEFDEARMRRYAERGAEVVFTIAFENDGTYSPEKNWVDFGAVILMWWSRALLQLLNGAHEQELTFMDGPFAIRVRSDPSTGNVELIPKGEQYSWRITLRDLGAAVIQAMEVVSDKLSEFQLDERHRTGLLNGARLLRAALAARSN